MFENNTIIKHMDRKQINSLVTQLFDGDIENLPDDFQRVEPLAFYEATLAEKNKRGYHAKVLLPCNYVVEKTESVVQKINEVRKITTGEQFDNFWNCFEPNLDISVWGSDEWNPRVLPNGAILIRNNQKVMAIEEQVCGQLDIRGYNLYAELEELENFINENRIENNHINFSILQRDEFGFIWTDSLPSTFSEVGQTLIFLSCDFLNNLHKYYPNRKDNIFFDPQLKQVAENSDSGHCVLRVFRHKTFIHSICRVSDYYDTILESYSYKLGDDPTSGTSFIFNVSTKFSHIKNTIKSIVQHEEPDLYKTEFIQRNRIMKMFLADKISEEYTNKKSLQVDSIFSIFGPYCDRPVSYYEENLQFWNTSQLHKGHMFLVNFNVSHTASEGGVNEFKQSLLEVLSKYKNEASNIKLYLPLKELNYINEDDLFDYESEDCNTRINQAFKELTRKQVNTINSEELSKYKNDEEAVREFGTITGNEYRFSALFFTPGIPQIEQCHQVGLEISKFMNCSIALHIPNYGFNQGYSCGEIDEGNYEQFIVLDK